MIPRRGFTRAASFHMQRLREVPPGYFFLVMTQGFGAMPNYREQISPRDRWAIAAYVRARHLGPRGTALRDDLDVFVTGVLLPERARQLTLEGDARPMLASLLEHWEDVKRKWQ